MRNALGIIAIGLLMLTTAPAMGQSKVGTTAAAFLEIGVGARQVALGEAGVAIVDDVTAMYWNPAGLAQTQKSQAGFEYNQWFGGISLQYGAAALNLGNAGRVGVHLYAMDSGEMDVTTLEFEDGTGETFRTTDFSLGLSYARYLTNTFALGGTVKLIQSRVWRMRASSVAVDLGVQYNTPFRNLRLGFAISNFGGEMTLVGDNATVRVDLDPNTSGDNDGILANLATRGWDLPLHFRIGVAYDVFNSTANRLTFTSDALYPNNNEQYVNLGLEYGFMQTFFVRAGYSNLFLPDTQGQGHLRAGFGLALLDTIRTDYALSDRGDLGTVHLIGATIQF